MSDGVKLVLQADQNGSGPTKLRCSAADVEEGMRLIAYKMRCEHPTLKRYLRSRSEGEAKSSREWEQQCPGCNQAAYRAGSSNAYLDIERMLERDGFSPEPPNDQAQVRRETDK